MVIGKIISYLALGLVGAFLLNTLIRPGSAIGTGAALQETGSGIKAIGQGIGVSLSALGTGGADLLQPLWELKNLIYSSSVPGAASVGPSAQVEGETNYGVLKPSSSTITWSSGTTANVPSLSPAATSYYKGLGVSVN